MTRRRRKGLLTSGVPLLGLFGLLGLLGSIEGVVELAERIRSRLTSRVRS